MKLANVSLAILLTLAALLSVPPLRAADLRIEEMLFDTQGRPRFAFNPKPDHYYVLYRGKAVVDVIHPTRIALGRLGARLIDAASFQPTNNLFFQIREVPLNQPLDLDGDGVDDVREILSNTDPLDPGSIPRGFRGGEAAPGTAVDLAAGDDLVFAALSEAGVAVFDAGVGLSPIPLKQVTTPGTALAVAYTLPWLVVADGAPGAAVLDVSDPSQPLLAAYFNAPMLGGGAAQAVAAVADLAFVGTTAGHVNLLHLSSGLLLQQINLGGRVEDLAIEGTTLYAYANGRLHVLPFNDGRLVVAGSAASPGTINSAHGRGRLFVGGRVAYIVHHAGYNTFDLSDPSAPRLLLSRNTADQGWKQLVLNGSGLGLAAVGRNADLSGPHRVGLYNTVDPAAAAIKVTDFSVPGIARAVNIYKGLGFVATHTNGLAVVNYLATDTRHQPPTLTLASDLPSPEVVAGSLVSVRAEIVEDVQTRSVEFSTNGVLAFTDGAYPFEFTFRVPPAAQSTTLTITARAMDTGGGVATSDPVVLDLLPCDEALVFQLLAPADGQEYVLGDDDLMVRIEPYATACIPGGFYHLVSASFRVDGQPVPARRTGTNDWIISPPLPRGVHELRATVTDAGGRTGEAAVGLDVRVEALSGPVTVFNRGTNYGREFLSRPVSVFNLGLAAPTAMSRPVTIFNAGDGRPEALSRQVAVVNTNNRPCVVAPAGLRHWWPFADHARDIQSNSNLTAAGNIRYGISKVGLGAYLDGAVDYFSLDGGSPIRGTNAFSIALWFATAHAGQMDRMALVTQADANHSGDIVRLWLNGGPANPVSWSVRGGAQSAFGEIYANRPVNDGKFHHIVATRGTNGTGRIYIDGALDSEQTGQPVSVGAAQFALGIDLRDLVLHGTGYLFNGWLDEVQIYTRALTPAEVFALYQADSAGICRP